MISLLKAEVLRQSMKELEPSLPANHQLITQVCLKTTITVHLKLVSIKS